MTEKTNIDPLSLDINFLMQNIIDISKKVDTLLINYDSTNKKLVTLENEMSKLQKEIGLVLLAKKTFSKHWKAIIIGLIVLYCYQEYLIALEPSKEPNPFVYILKKLRELKP